MVTAVVSFSAAAALLVIAPGPDSLLVLRNSLRRGRRLGLVTSAGILTGLLVWGAVAALGLAALLRASEVGYTVVRLCGAAYLVTFGTKLLLARGRGVAFDQRRGPRSTTAAYLSGVGTNLFNPKVGVFFVSFLPAFVPSGASVGWTTFLFAVIFITEGMVWLLAIVVFAGRLGETIRRPKVSRRLERCSGAVMIGFGIRLATEAR